MAVTFIELTVDFEIESGMTCRDADRRRLDRKTQRTERRTQARKGKRMEELRSRGK
ncbi:hypothetical protein DIPPA_22607 [Diplonema papillatum]|nr:hypothetical protein DIPPA_22607 [Diplonema papillatum]